MVHWKVSIFASQLANASGWWFPKLELAVPWGWIFQSPFFFNQGGFFQDGIFGCKKKPPLLDTSIPRLLFFFMFFFPSIRNNFGKLLHHLDLVQSFVDVSTGSFLTCNLFCNRWVEVADTPPSRFLSTIFQHIERISSRHLLSRYIGFLKILGRHHIYAIGKGGCSLVC